MRTRATSALALVMLTVIAVTSYLIGRSDERRGAVHHILPITARAKSEHDTSVAPSINR